MNPSPTPALAPVDLFVFWHAVMVLCGLPLAAALVLRALLSTYGRPAGKAAAGTAVPAPARRLEARATSDDDRRRAREEAREAVRAEEALRREAGRETGRPEQHEDPAGTPSGSPTEARPEPDHRTAPAGHTTDLDAAAYEAAFALDEEAFERALARMPDGPRKESHRVNFESERQSRRFEEELFQGVPHPPPSGEDYGSYDDPAWQRGARDAAARRRNLGAARERVRTAVLSLAESGHYVFADLPAASGPVDQLVIGSRGVTAVLAMPHGGHVWRDGGGGGPLVWGRESLRSPSEDPEIAALTAERDNFWWGGPMEEDYDEFRADIVEELVGVFGERHPTIRATLCFPMASLEHVSSAGRVLYPEGCVGLMDLVEHVADPADGSSADAALPLSPDEIDGYAASILAHYGRTPWVRPDGREDMLDDHGTPA